MLDGYTTGLILGALTLSVALNVWLWWGLPSLIGGIIEEYTGLKPRASGQQGKKPEGLMGFLLENRGMISSFLGRGNPSETPGAVSTVQHSPPYLRR